MHFMHVTTLQVAKISSSSEAHPLMLLTCKISCVAPSEGAYECELKNQAKLKALHTKHVPSNVSSARTTFTMIFFLLFSKLSYHNLL